MNRLIIVSNRFRSPSIRLAKIYGRSHGDGRTSLRIEPVLRDRGGVWIGWPELRAKFHKNR